MKLIFIIGIILYSIGEGVTEGLTWEGSIDSAKYHLWRVVEMLGIIFFSYYLFSSTYSFTLLFIILFGSILFCFLVYRISFILVRRQSCLSPSWHWDIYVPILNKVITVSYPPSFVIVIFGLFGLFLLFWGLE